MKYMVRLNTQRERNNIQGRPRLLKIVLDNEGTKLNLLKAGGKLKNSSDPDLRDVVIKPDLTFKERKAYAELAKVRDAKNRELAEKGILDRKFVIRDKRLREMKIQTILGAVGGRE